MWTYRNKRKLTLSLLLVTISLLACNRGGGTKKSLKLLAADMN